MRGGGGGGAGKRKFESSFSDEDKGIECCELSKTRKVTVRPFKGSVLVDIREYFTKDGQTFPGKKGISLTLEQWEVLRNHVDKIDEALKEY